MNLEPLKLAVKAIEAEPSTLDMTMWARGSDMVGSVKVDNVAMDILNIDSCGTTMCLAGHIVHSAGWLFVGRRCLDDSSSFFTAVNPETGESDSVSDAARKMLDIDEETAFDLFVDGCAKIYTVEQLKGHIKTVLGVNVDE